LTTSWVSRPAATVCALCLAVPVAAQRVTLEVRPRPGDTLYVTLDQSVTITGGPRNFPDSATTITTTYHVATRDIIERADEKGTFVLAVVDSMRMKTTGSFGASPFPGVDRGMERVRVRLRVMRDGSSQIVDGITQLDPELRELLGEMPSVLPTAPVKAGDSWTRNLPLPAGPDASGQESGTLRATFKLDSLSDNGDRAWISMRGRLDAGAMAADGDGATVTKMTGTLTGTLVLDRRRGWLDRTQARVDIESIVATPGGGAPLLVKVRVEQLMQTVAPRR